MLLAQQEKIPQHLKDNDASEEGVHNRKKNALARDIHRNELEVVVGRFHYCWMHKNEVVVGTLHYYLMHRKENAGCDIQADKSAGETAAHVDHKDCHSTCQDKRACNHDRRGTFDHDWEVEVEAHGHSNTHFVVEAVVWHSREQHDPMHAEVLYEVEHTKTLLLSTPQNCILGAMDISYQCRRNSTLLPHEAASFPNWSRLSSSIA